MIGKATKGRDFGGLAHYLTRDGRGKVLDMRGLSSDTPEAAAAEMQLTASMSRRTKNSVMHISVRTAPGDPRLSDDEMREDAGLVLSSLGLDQHQAVVVRHGDDHFHIMANRVGADGRAVSDSNSYSRIEATLRQIEAERGLTVVSGRHAPDADGQRMTGPRSSRDPRQHQARESVRQALLTSRSRVELDNRLAQDGWRMEVTRKPGKQPGALLIGPEGQRIAAGRIDRNATLSKINARFGSQPIQVSGPRTASPTMRITGLNSSPAAMPGGRKLIKLAPAGKKKSPLGTNRSMKNAGAESMKLFGQVAGGAALLGAAVGRRRKLGRRLGGGLSL